MRSKNVYPGKGNMLVPDSKLYYTVAVYDTRKAMVDAIKKDTGEPGDDIDAMVHMCESHRKVKRVPYYPCKRCKKKTNYLGKVYFFEAGFTVDVIAHEALHMAIGFLDRKKGFVFDSKKDDKSDNEERMAYTTQCCVYHIIK